MNEIIGLSQLTEYQRKILSDVDAQHMAAISDKTDYVLVKVWNDEHGCICAQYQNGKWYHYNEKGEWW